jgi:hypothetical protein
MTRKAEQLAMSLAITVVVACTLGVLAHHPRDAAFQQLLHLAEDHDARWSAYVIFQAADCESRLDFLALFDRAAIVSRVRARQLVFVGDASDLARIERDFGPRAHGLPISLADDRLGAALGQIGARTTPMLVLLDDSGAVRFVSPGPRTPTEYVGLAHSLSSLDVAR